MEFSKQYPLPPFQSQDDAKIKTIIERYPLASLILQTSDGPMVSQVPLIYQQSSTVAASLVGHMDNNNPWLGQIRKKQDVYCVFNGPNGYISPAIYPNTQYPGWNYVSVHITGQISIVESKQKLSESLLELAKRNEPINSGYVLSPRQKNYTNLLSFITGIQIEIIDQKAILKLAQDKPTSHTTIAKEYLSKLSKMDISDFLGEMLD